MNTKILYINTKSEGIITCPNCDRTQGIKASNWRLPIKLIRVKCQCGNDFHLTLRHRRAYRKKVYLPGKLFQSQSDRQIDDIVITSLSVTGVSFIVRSALSIKIQDVLEIAFTLDDGFGSILREDIVVKRVEGRYVCAKFASQEEYNFALDFYLTPFVLSSPGEY